MLLTLLIFIPLLGILGTTTGISYQLSDGVISYSLFLAWLALFGLFLYQ
jgi:hypothetical protein